MDYLKVAIKNISNYGDTDIFPFPVENALFYDLPDQVEIIISDMESNFTKWVAEYPVDCIKTCVPKGNTGYIWATTIDPLWNCFFLYQTLKIAETLESKRIPVEKDSVFSYRLKIDEETGKLFSQETTWRSFHNKALKNADSGDFSYVVRFDISDFYNRIYHHRLENALLKSDSDGKVNKYIMSTLQDISGNVSYGLPIGGNAARILAEIVLNSLDQMMTNKRFTFCRYVDDYIVFAKTREDAYRKLNYCADFLLRNEGLSLQKSKTQILTSAEFVSYARAIIEGEDDEDSREKAEFLKLHIRYDPYSANPQQDYEEIKEKICQFDILSLLKSEIRKSRIHHALGKQIMSAVTYLEGEKLDLAFNIIESNIEILYPVFPSVMQVARKKLKSASIETQLQFIDMLYRLAENDSYILQTDNNASYAVRVMSAINNDKSIQAIELLHSRMLSPLVKYNCMYAMTNLNNHYWLSDIKSRFSMLSRWERRAFILASYYLKDEGQHWRLHTKEQFSKLEVLIKEWVALKEPVQNGWILPI